MSFKNLYYFFMMVMVLALVQILFKFITDSYHFHLAILAAFSLGMIGLGLRAGVNKWLVGIFGIFSFALIAIAWFVIWNGIELWKTL